MTDYDGARTESATDELRRLLDERGVEYEAPHAGFTIVRTSNLVCKYYETLEEPERGVFAVTNTDWLTPEQAIAATLGEGTCHNSAPSYLDFLCSECGFVHYHSDTNDTGDGNEWCFCPNCGAKIVGPTTNDVDAEVDE